MAWAIENGYHVFRNQSPNGPIDLVLVKNWETTWVDVKTASTKTVHGEYFANTLTKEQVRRGVLRIAVSRDGPCFMDDGRTAIVKTGV